MAGKPRAVDAVADITREIDRLIGSIRGMEAGAQGFAPLTSRLHTASSKLGEARLDLSDSQRPASENVGIALARIRTAKMLMAEGVALKEEYDMRLSWGGMHDN